MPAQYSKTVVSAADRFLSEYNLTFEKLTEPQQKQVVIYVRAKKWWPLMLVILLVSLVVFGYGVLDKYNQMQEFIGQAVILSDSGTEIDLQKVSSFSLEQGFIIGFFALSAFYMILYAIIIPINLRNQKCLLHVFLSSIKSKPIDESHKQS